VLGELMTAEVVELAGPRGKHDPARDAYRIDLLGSGGRIRGQQVGYTRVSSQARLNARSCTVATQTPSTVTASL